MFGDKIHHTAQPVPSEDSGAFEEDFDRLLDQSSVGAANAVAIQAMTPDEVVDRLQERMPFGDPGLAGPPGEAEQAHDIDDVLLHLVRLVAKPPASEPPGAAGEREGPPLPVAFVSHISLTDDHSRSSIISAMVRELAAANVFGYVRRDVARSIIEIGLGDEHDGRSLMRRLARAAASCSGLAEEVAEHLRGQPGHRERTVETIQPGVDAIGAQARDLRALIERNLAELSHRMAASGASPVRWWESHHSHETTVDMRDALVHTVVRFGIRWYSRKFAFLIRYGRDRADTRAVDSPTIESPTIDSPTIDMVSGSLLGLLHSGPLNTRIVLTSVNGTTGFPHITRRQLRGELRSLHRRGLVRPVTRRHSHSLVTRYRLTGEGQQEFQNWLLAKPGGVRGAIVLHLLLATPFTQQQYERLRTLTVFLNFDEEQTRDLSNWITHNLRGARARYPTGANILNSLLEPTKLRLAGGKARHGPYNP